MTSIKKKSKFDISVVIVNYNVKDFLCQAILSLQTALKGISSEIIVVDNASDDGSSEMVNKRFPRVVLIKNSDNFGFAKANNIALRQAKGRYILLINPDTIVQEDTIKVMLKFLDEHTEVGLAGCKILNPDGSFQLSCRRGFPTPWVAFTKLFGLSRLFPKSKIFGQYNLTYLDIDETYPVDAVSGSFMMVRNDVIKEVGGLDERYFMYGEDLDWCYRIRQAGWQIYYVHTTQLIHYKGESTKRSSLDEIKIFYDAMHLFVEKHFNASIIFNIVLKLAIAIVSFAAFITSVLRPLRVAIFDYIAVLISIGLAEEIWRGTFLKYPNYAYPIVLVVPAVIVIGCLYAAGVYTNKRMSVSRTIIATFAAYVIISALTAMFKEYAFSRMIMGISGIFAVIFIAGWRLILRLLGLSTAYGRKRLFSKRTLIVGTNKDATELQKRLRKKVGAGYELIGFIGTTHQNIGKKIDGLEVIGSIANVGKIIKDMSISDVIFAPKALSYAQVLSVIGKSRDQSVSFHLVPTTMEVIIGKASVDSLDDLPLVQITYNIDKSYNRFIKRSFDISLSILLLAGVYPIFRLINSNDKIKKSNFLKYLPSVLRGKFSFVGPSEQNFSALKVNGETIFLGRPGLCGLVQLQRSKVLTNEEIDQYNLYYARNQSIMLDVEILIKSWMQSIYSEKRTK